LGATALSGGDMVRKRPRGRNFGVNRRGAHSGPQRIGNQGTFPG